jgi:hypothetical protein
MWINQLEVLYRFGENGRIYILYDHNSMEPWIPNALINKPVKKTVKKSNKTACHKKFSEVHWKK